MMILLFFQSKFNLNNRTWEPSIACILLIITECRERAHRDSTRGKESSREEAKERQDKRKSKKERRKLRERERERAVILSIKRDVGGGEGVIIAPIIYDSGSEDLNARNRRTTSSISVLHTANILFSLLKERTLSLSLSLSLPVSFALCLSLSDYLLDLRFVFSLALVQHSEVGGLGLNEQ